jgi:alpha-L-arabinofuranosidase
VRKFTGSIFAKPVGGPPEIEVSLRARDRSDIVFSRTSLNLNAQGWRQYDFTLEVPPDKLAPLEEADFVIAVTGAGRVLVDQVLLFPSDHVRGMNPEMVALSKALRSPVLRYGGNFTSGYHWRDGIGSADRRVSMLNHAWGMPEYNHFGTDEFLEFCRLIGAEPQIALNLGSGTPDEAASWVRYVNQRWNTGKGGLLWELGNELWGDWQIGYPLLSELRERTIAFSRAVRAADPKARLIATGQDPDKFEQWNAELLQAPAAYDYLATHFVVVPTEILRRDASPDFVASSALAYPVALEKRLRLMKEQIDSVDGARGRVNLAFTEWLFYGRDDRGPRFMNQGGALLAAGFLNMLMRTADFVPIANMTGLIEFGGIWQKKARVFGTPAYYAFRMYSTADIATPVSTSVSGVAAYDVTGGNRRVPEIAGVPYLDVFAARNESGDKLTLFCVNRDLHHDIETDIYLSGFASRGTARVLQLSAPSIYNGNDETDPDAVVPMETAIPVENSRLRYSFARAAITVIEFATR